MEVPRWAPTASAVSAAIVYSADGDAGAMTSGVLALLAIAIIASEIQQPIRLVACGAAVMLWGGFIATAHVDDVLGSGPMIATAVVTGLSTAATTVRAYRIAYGLSDSTA